MFQSENVKPIKSEQKRRRIWLINVIQSEVSKDYINGDAFVFHSFVTQLSTNLTMSDFAGIQAMSSKELIKAGRELINSMAKCHNLEIASPHSKFIPNSLKVIKLIKTFCL